MTTTKTVFLCLAASAIFIGGDAFRKKKGTQESSFMESKDSMTTQQQKHLETLSNLQALARQIVSGEEKISPTSKLALTSIEGEMIAVMADTEKQHQENQQELESARHAISYCGVEATQKHTGGNGINEQRKSVDEGRIDHHSCRIMETSSLTDKAEKCEAFQTYNDNLSPPSCAASFPDGPSDSRLECISKLKEWSTQHDREYREKKTLCDDATLLHDQTKTGCDNGQASFESGFCTYASTLSEACDAQIRCRTEFITARNKTHSQVKVTEGGRKAEYKSAKMIMCLLDVLKAESAEMRGMLTGCEKLAVDTTHLDMVYPAIPPTAACDPSPVATKPCGDSWLNTEYKSKTEWYDFTRATEKVVPSSCVACAATEQLVVEKLQVPTWHLVFRQTHPFMYVRDEWSKNAKDPSNANFAILDQLEQYRRDGAFTFKLSWPSSSLQDQVWKQTSNPVSEKYGVYGYEAIDAPHTGQNWAGLEHGSQTLLDGSVSHGNWYYAVGSFQSWGGGIPGPGVAVQEVELYVKA